MNHLLPILLSAATFVSTFIGGHIAIRYKKWLHYIMCFTAGVLIGVVAFDIFPEIVSIIKENNFDATGVSIAGIIGFILFFIFETKILMHHSHEDEYGEHKHPHVGIASAIALAGHSFMDGVGIGLGFQVNQAVGILVAIAVIAHDFTDGMNTVTLVLLNKNHENTAKKFLYIDAIAPILGVVSTLFFHLPESFLVLYLGFFAGFLSYIGGSDILPEAHSEGSSNTKIALTLFGLLFIFIVTRFV